MKEGMPWMWMVLSGVITPLLDGVVVARWARIQYLCSRPFPGRN
jgi:hypothetical protein